MRTRYGRTEFWTAVSVFAVVSEASERHDTAFASQVVSSLIRGLRNDRML